jgi:glycosyltransferase involved in cell wall biosynthesis
VGRLTVAKGLDILLQAVSELRSNRLLDCVAIVGDGPLLPMLREKAKQLAIENRVCFLGARNDVNTLLQQSKLFVLPSRWEGLPLSVLEAMAFGIPVIASNVGGIPEVITHGVNGLLVKPEAPKILAEAIEKLLSNRKLARTLGHTARKHILTHYSIEEYTNSIFDLYNEILPEA